MKDVDVGKDRLNLLPPAFHRKMLWHSRIRQWSVAIGLCVVVASAACLREHHELHVRKSVLELRRLRTAPLQTVQTQNNELRERLVRFRDEQQLGVELESEQLAFHLLSTVSRSASACVDAVQVQQFSFSRTRSTVNTQPAKTDGQPQNSDPGHPQQNEIETLVMTVKGIGADNLTVSRFVVALRDSQVFDKVDLKSSIGGAGPARGIRSFVVECTL